MATQQFTYVFTEGGFTDVIVANVTTPATNSTGEGFGYSVTSITGSLQEKSITGEVGTGGVLQHWFLPPNGWGLGKLLRR